MAWPDASTTAVILGGLLIIIALRLLQNLLPGRSPPVFEGLPFIGGILKFSKVCILVLMAWCGHVPFAHMSCIGKSHVKSIHETQLIAPVWISMLHGVVGPVESH